MLMLDGQAPDRSSFLPPAVVRQIFSHQTGAAKRNTDAPFFNANLFGGRCVNSETQAASNIDYGFGAVHHLGFKSEAWAHGSHMGAAFFIAPERFAFYFSSVFPSGSTVVMARVLKAIDAFEQSNSFTFKGPLGEAPMAMCPTSVELSGDTLGYGRFDGTPPEFGPDGRLATSAC